MRLYLVVGFVIIGMVACIKMSCDEKVSCPVTKTQLGDDWHKVEYQGRSYLMYDNGYRRCALIELK